MGKIIPLTQGMSTIVDEQDFYFLSRRKWFAAKGRTTFYARSKDHGRLIHMHRLILAAKPGEQVDHKDRNTLNNQRDNLRIANSRQQAANRGMRVDNSSGFKGVTWMKQKNKWRAQLGKGKEGTIALGDFLDAKLAALAYDNAAIQRFGPFAATNSSFGLL